MREDGCGCGGGCGCGDMGSWRGGMHHHMLKRIICLIVLAITFWAGIKIGELKGRVEYGWSGYSRMMGHGYGDTGSYPMRPGMMQGWGWDNGYGTSTQQ